MLTAERLKRLLLYDPETGVWTWIAPTSNRVSAGSAAGTLTDTGYRIIAIDGKRYRASRLALLFMEGRWPSHDMDHRDGVRSNDRWLNLREATRSQNLWNEGLDRRSTSGIKGVSWVARRRKWTAQIACGRRKFGLGYFDTKEEAAAARRAAEREMHGEFAR